MWTLLGYYSVINDALLNFSVSVELDGYNWLEKKRGDCHEFNRVKTQLVFARVLKEILSNVALFGSVLGSHIVHVSRLKGVVVERAFLLWNSDCPQWLHSWLHSRFVDWIDSSVGALAQLTLWANRSHGVSANCWSFDFCFPEPAFH